MPLTRINSGSVAENAITTTELEDGTIVAVDIADDAVTAAKVSGLTNASSGVVSADGDGTFSIDSTVLSNVSEDTSPQLGGDLDTNSNDVNFGDSDKAQFGASNDLQIYHDGSNSYIKEGGTGDLKIQANEFLVQNAAGTGTGIHFDPNTSGEVKLYHNNNEKLKTVSTGIDVTGNVTTDTARSADVVDNDGSFDLDAGTNFTCTPTANFTLTFTNIPDGQSGTIVLINTGGYTVSAASTTKVMGADLLTTITTAGTYVLGYISDGTNVRVYNSGAQQ